MARVMTSMPRAFARSMTVRRVMPSRKQSGFGVWIYTLLLPSFAKSGWLGPDFLAHGAFGLELLRPEALFGLRGLDYLTH